MEIKTLYTLLAIIDHRSFSEAGKAVGLSASGVSLQIKSLEAEFGVTLFDRSTRPPTLTWDGQAFVNRARELLDVWEDLNHGLAKDSLAGILHLGAVPTLVSGVLPIALGRLRRKCPDLQIRLTTGLSHELEALLIRGSLDAALVTQAAQVREDLTWSAFGSEPLQVIAPRNVEGTTDREILQSGPFIRFKRSAWVGRLIDDALRRFGIEVIPGMEVDTLEGIFGLVANGLGVSVVPRRNLARPFPPDVKVVPFGDPVVSRSLGILQRFENPRAHFVQQLHEALAGVSRPVSRQEARSAVDL